MIVKIHKTSDGKKIVALCDKDLIGKILKEKNIRLDLSSNFYKGEEKTEKEVMKIFDDAYIVNIVGERSIDLCKKAGIVLEDTIIYVKKIPHAQAILF